MKAVSWMTSEQAREHLQLPSMNAFYIWLHRERQRTPCRLKVRWLRGRLRFRQVDLDACLEAEPARGLRLVKGAREA